MDEYLNLNVLVLAFVGDAVYTQKVRDYLVKNFAGKVNDLHKKANKIVCCEFQAKILDLIDNLNDTEINIIARARNAKKNTSPKRSNASDYNKSTELEAIIGYHHLQNNNIRLNQIFDLIFKSIE